MRKLAGKKNKTSLTDSSDVLLCDWRRLVFLVDLFLSFFGGFGWFGVVVAGFVIGSLLSLGGSGGVSLLCFVDESFAAGLRGGLAGLEAVNAAFGVDNLFFASEEWMRFTRNVDFD